MSLIIGLSEEQQETLLEELELKLFKEKRRHARKPFRTVVDFVSQGRTYKEFIRDISESGVYIHVSDLFPVGQDIVLAFSFDVDRKGRKVRVRLYGVDTPERSQWYGQNAKTFTPSQVMGKMVEMQETGRAAWDRVEGIVMVGNLNINRHLLEYG